MFSQIQNSPNYPGGGGSEDHPDSKICGLVCLSVLTSCQYSLSQGFITPPLSSVTRIFSNILIIGTEYQIFEDEYSIFWFQLYSLFVFGQIANILFDIHIWSGCKEQIYLIFVFGKLFENDFIRYLYLVKSFYKYIFICIP